MSTRAFEQVNASHNAGYLRDILPAFARDIKLNLGTVLTLEGAPDLSLNQIMGIALASACASRHPEVISGIYAEAVTVLSEAEINAAKTAAALMAMNNVYYRFTHLVHDEELSKLPAKLRMTAMATHGIPKADFELYCLAVSAINGCGACMEAHAHEVGKAGISKAGIQSSVRIAAVINAVAQALM